ncbi:MAG TPA: hypothetical protein VIG33_01010 [Pseudobdellovibrionaceae bacterium]|jgi:hypothetical protein
MHRRVFSLSTQSTKSSHREAEFYFVVEVKDGILQVEFEEVAEPKGLLASVSGTFAQGYQDEQSYVLSDSQWDRGQHISLRASANSLGVWGDLLTKESPPF